MANMNQHGSQNPNYRHGGRCIHKRLWNTLSGMKQRCQNPNNPKYPRYGGRGIRVCEEWQNFEGFLSWATAHGWRDGLSIDRIDLDKNYCPENCQFLTISENSRWKSTTKNIASKPRLDRGQRNESILRRSTTHLSLPMEAS